MTGFLLSFSSNSVLQISFVTFLLLSSSFFQFIDMRGESFVLGKKCRKVCCVLKRFICNEASFETREFKLNKLRTSPLTKTTVTREEVFLYYKQMLTIRWLETTVESLFQQKHIRGFCHLQIGQEACAVGMKAAMRSVDSVISGYRVHGWSYLMGSPVSELIAELLGKQSGSSKGKGGSMHIYRKNFYGGNGIVGAQVPIGTGVALAAQYLKTGGICFTIYGDGAAKQGQVYEAFNMAKLWNLPCVFVCENNGQALSLANSAVTISGVPSLGIIDYYCQGDYIPGIWVDGTDVLTVREASRFAIKHCLTGQGPIILELCTPAETDSSSSAGSTDKKHTQDPIISFRERILLADLITEEECKLINEDVKNTVAKSVMKAQLDNDTSLLELTKDVYVLSLEEKIRNIKPQNY